MIPEERSARIADAQALLDLLKADDSLPLPSEMLNLGFYFRADGRAAEARRRLAALEAAIPAEFGPGYEDASSWVIDGVMPGGVKVKLKAWARDVVEKKVTGTRVVEDVEWVRLPVESGPGSGES